MIISLLGTIVMLTLFVFELNEYFTMSATTTLVVDELVDETLRVNFNVTMHQVPCEYLSVDVSDLTGTSRHNISKDILKWRLDSQQRVITSATAVAARSAAERLHDRHETHGGAYDVFDPNEYEPPDTNLSAPLTAEDFEDFLGKHELTVVNFFAPWCIWCRRFEPVYLETAQKIPELQFHGHARLAQVDCVANQAFCQKNMIRAYPTVRMYKDGDPVHFELFTGARTVPALIGFIQQQMDMYKVSHSVARKANEARFVVKHGALSAGSDLYRARMDTEAAQTYCGNNPGCAGFTWQSRSPPPSPPGAKASFGPAEAPLVYFKGGISVEQAHRSMNTDQAWTSYIKTSNATVIESASSSLSHGPEGCRLAGHLSVRKVPGTLKLALHSTDHDHISHMINSSHVVNELWFGEPLSAVQRRILPAADQAELLSPTSHRLDGLPFVSADAGHSHVHYLKVVTKVLKHEKSFMDTLAYKYTVHSNRYETPPKEEPTIEFKYDLSPISIVLKQESMPAYRFVTSSCAIIGGVFTVIGLLENIIHHTSSAVMKKTI